ncbi:CpaD family pilus assembly protein [Bradyrhizobium sp. CB1650]|uniref:CpaD family pilus assembly protein n=1 Tax=Bradyrhizobium sp. CB1650 TaxID=3039153 RepID=UPI0024353C0D|nr:CpaD family pilus assembly protein [Bradyrhizobium sp. CB1650]WGD51891.1 CpaD family pilus assembly protein [Bradyrhizobium sp. CB1650]
MITRPPQIRKGAIRLGGALVGMALALGGCQHDEAVTASIPDDYKQRHPIAIEEQNRSIVVFVGHARGGLTAAQRADVMSLASTWLREGTGAIHIDVPAGTPNARPAAESLREIQAMMAAAGVPPRAVMARPYQPEDKRFLPPIRLTYSKIAAVAGPCGVWPEDIGPSMKNRGWFENKQYYNFGCAYQRNLAAMVDNPTDLEQPRPETPSYTARRTTLLEKYRKGTPTAITYPEADKAKLSDTGK